MSAIGGTLVGFVTSGHSRFKDEVWELIRGRGEAGEWDCVESWGLLLLAGCRVSLDQRVSVGAEETTAVYFYYEGPLSRFVNSLRTLVEKRRGTAKTVQASPTAEWETVQEWEPNERQVGIDKTERLRVPGGWLYRTVITNCFVNEGTETSNLMAAVFVPDPGER